MKFNARKLTFAVTLITGLLIAHGTTLAQNPANTQSNARPSRVVGLWDVDVIVADCTNGATLATFSALHQYQQGGTGQVVPSSPPTALSAHMAIWKWIEGNEYQQTVKMFRFDPQGAAIGWIVIDNDISISENGNDYVGSGRAKIYNMGGTQVGESCPSFVGTRFTG